MHQPHLEVKVLPKLFADNIPYIRDRVAPARIYVVMKANAYEHRLKALAARAVETGFHVNTVR